MVFETLKKDLWIRIDGLEDFDFCIEKGSVVYFDDVEVREIKKHIRNWEDDRELVIAGAMVKRKLEITKPIKKTIDLARAKINGFMKKLG